MVICDIDIKGSENWDLVMRRGLNESLNDSAKDTMIVIYFLDQINCLPTVIAEKITGEISETGFNKWDLGHGTKILGITVSAKVGEWSSCGCVCVQ